ncbi:unnamed protein product [Lactuca saligna]|uniref:Alkyl transferase n=1 Tax=Lactuca saligna TaxID=75948 RepID=A0AA36E9E2_LACSI|nr:unnamed protein product [Lactuca saligna]
MLYLSLSSPTPRSYLPKPFSLSTNKPRFHVLSKNQFSGGGNTSPEEPVVTPEGLRRELMPKHVAVIMDGNRRWAQSQRLLPQVGYLAGAAALKSVMDVCRKWGIQIEVDPLLGMFVSKIKDEIAYMERENIRLSVIGDVSKLPQSLREVITHAENATKNNSQLNLVIAINYSGKYDIVQACQSICQKVKDGVVEPEEINEFMIDNELCMNLMRFPDPDLLIRTSGEVRVSNFFLWQLAYTELYFTENPLAGFWRR